MAYDGTDSLSQWDVTRPDGATEQGNVVDNAIREVKRVTKTVIELQHTSTGEHRDGIISQAALAANSVSTVKIVDGAVIVTKLGDGAVTTAKILDSNVTAAKLAADSVITVKIQDGAVTGAKCATASITNNKLLSTTPFVAGRIWVEQADGTMLAKAPSGAVTMNANGVFTLGQGLKIAVLKDSKTINTQGGSITAATDTIRDLNSLTGDTTFIQVAANLITLAPGTYFVFGDVPGYEVGAFVAWLYNQTTTADTTILGLGQAALGNTGRASLMGVLAITTSTNYYLKMRSELAKATDGLGKASNIKGETYSQLTFVQLSSAAV